MPEKGKKWWWAAIVTTLDQSVPEEMAREVMLDALRRKVEEGDLIENLPLGVCEPNSHLVVVPPGQGMVALDD